jgi:quercetin dioxygenase-like cupin family protein
MKVFKTQEYIQRKNPSTSERLREDILTEADNARQLAGIFVILPPGGEVPYHFHEGRESLIFIISGQGIEKVEDEEFTVTAGDVIYIPALEKHMLINNSSADLHYLEYFAPINKDFVVVK